LSVEQGTRHGVLARIQLGVATPFKLLVRNW
jgi:hypothetical protein